MNTSFYLERFDAGAAVASLPPPEVILWPFFTQYDRRCMRLVRDFSVGGDIVDICSIAARVAIELNAYGAGVESDGDRRRRERIRASGYHIITVTAGEIYANPSTVHDRLMAEMRRAIIEAAEAEQDEPDEVRQAA